jgi:hypothetical protein
MLYDKKWDEKQKLDIYSLESFAAWLDQQPRDKEYDYGDSQNCASAQYLKYHNVSKYALSPNDLRKLDWHDIVYSVDRCFPIGVDANLTFGDAADRAHNKLQKQRLEAKLKSFISWMVPHAV